MFLEIDPQIGSVISAFCAVEGLFSVLCSRGTVQSYALAVLQI